FVPKHEDFQFLTIVRPKAQHRKLKHAAKNHVAELKVPTNRVNVILNGQRAISGDTALRLAHFFGTTPQFWLNLQSLYEIRLAEEKSGKAIKKLPSLKRVEEVHA